MKDKRFFDIIVTEEPVEQKTICNFQVRGYFSQKQTNEIKEHIMDLYDIPYTSDECLPDVFVPTPTNQHIHIYLVNAGDGWEEYSIMEEVVRPLFTKQISTK